MPQSTKKNITDTNKLLAESPIGRAFAKLAAPAIAAQLINITYSMVDKMYVGHIPGAGSEALAGVGVTIPVIFTISSFAALISMGGAPKASMLLGEGKKGEAERVMGACTWLLTVMSIFLTAVILLFVKPILQVFGASDETMPYAIDFMNIYCLGTLFTQLTLGLNAFIAAQGKTFIGMVSVAVGAVINIALDWVFVMVLQLGVRGTALGTVISQGVSSCFVIWYLTSARAGLKLRKSNIRFDWKLLSPCILLGASPALMQVTENLVAISFNTSLETHGGDLAVASMCILTTVMQFTMMLLPGLVQGAQSLLSYNYGAGNIDRVKKTFRLLLISCVTGSFLIWAICMSVPGLVASAFTSDAQLIEYTQTSMRIYLATLLIYGIQVACQCSFVALNQAKKAIFLTIWRKIILLIPFIFILPNFVFDPQFGVFLAEPVADTIAACTTAVMFYRYYKRL